MEHRDWPMQMLQVSQGAGGPSWTWRDYEPVAAPLLTPDHLSTVLKLLTGSRPDERLDTAAAAQLVRVSPRTIQRWLPTNRSRRKPAAPNRTHAATITAAALPSPLRLRHEEQAADYAVVARQRISVPRGRGILPEWRNQGWLDPHVVMILNYERLGIQQVSSSRIDIVASELRLLGDPQRPPLRRRGGGVAVSSVTVTDGFAATVLKHAVLRIVHNWRIRPGGSLVPRGSTHLWLASLTAPDLRELAVQLSLD